MTTDHRPLPTKPRLWGDTPYCHRCNHDFPPSAQYRDGSWHIWCGKCGRGVMGDTTAQAEQRWTEENRVEL